MRQFLAQIGGLWTRLRHRMTLLKSLRTRSTRLRTAWAVVWMLLFQQLALAAYACPAFDSQHAAPQHEPAMADCADMAMGTTALDPQAPALCSQDCQDDHAVRSSSPADLPAAPSALLMYFVPVDEFLIPDDAPRISAVLALHADPPLTQRFCRLLI